MLELEATNFIPANTHIAPIGNFTPRYWLLTCLVCLRLKTKNKLRDLGWMLDENFVVARGCSTLWLRNNSSKEVCKLRDPPGIVYWNVSIKFRIDGAERARGEISEGNWEICVSEWGCEFLFGTLGSFIRRKAEGSFLCYTRNISERYFRGNTNKVLIERMRSDSDPWPRAGKYWCLLLHCRWHIK